MNPPKSTWLPSAEKKSDGESEPRSSVMPQSSAAGPPMLASSGMIVVAGERDLGIALVEYEDGSVFDRFGGSVSIRFSRSLSLTS